MKRLLPLTVGLLVSAMVRRDHGLFAPYFPDDPFGSLGGPPETRIPEAMDAVVEIYHAAAVGRTLATVTERQVAEEFFGEGFYRPEGEEGYASLLDAYGLRRMAQDRINHIVHRGDD